jgi:glycine C-acetyltransferase
MNKNGTVLQSPSGSKTAFLQEELEKLKSQNLWWTLRVHQAAQAARTKVDGRQVISLASNNYLGLANHPKLKKAAIQAVQKYGVGSGAVRPIAGTMAIHEELEKKLATFKHTEASLVFQSGYISNVAVVSTVMGEGDLIISDQLNHASIIDGARVTKSERKVYAHCDLVALEQLLKDAQGK